MLFLYLTVSDHATSSVLVREEEGVQYPIYYTSKALLDAETRYPSLEKWALALVVAAQKLRPYFQAFLVSVITNQPLRQTLHKPDASGRLVKWAIELSEFDISFKPRAAIKAQAMADFVQNSRSPKYVLASCILLQPTTKLEYGRYLWMDHQGSGVQEQGLSWKAQRGRRSLML